MQSQDSGSSGVKPAPQLAVGRARRLCLPEQGFKARTELSYFPVRRGLRLKSGQAASDCGEFWSSGQTKRWAWSFPDSDFPSL